MKAILHSILVIVLILPPLAAHQDHDHTHDETTSQIPIPSTLSKLGAAIESGHQALGKAIADRDSSAVHAAESQLQTYLKAIPERTADLPEASRIRILGQAKNLSRVYNTIHHAADDQDWEKSALEMIKADTVLPLFMSLLPKK